MSNPYHHAAKTAYLLYKKFANDALNHRADLLIVNLLSENNLRVDFANIRNTKFSGMLIIDEFESTIMVNQNHIHPKRLFTIAHELGHYYLHKNESTHFLDEEKNFYGQSEVLMEQQANVFASEILLPQDSINLMLYYRYNFYRIAKKTGASYECLKWRLVRHILEKYDCSLTDCRQIIDEYITNSGYGKSEYRSSYIFKLPDLYTPPNYLTAPMLRL